MKRVLCWIIRGIKVSIIGGGATGVELAAQLHESVRLLSKHGLELLAPFDKVKIMIVEAGDRLVPALPKELSEKVEHELVRKNIQVFLNTAVKQVKSSSLVLSSGQVVTTHMKIWAAGISAPPAIKSQSAFEHDRIERIAFPI